MPWQSSAKCLQALCHTEMIFRIVSYLLDVSVFVKWQTGQLYELGSVA